GEVHSGAALMNCGINVNVSGDFTSKVVYFTEE
ncbi:MAG: GH36 C-terminal domain-containing protein, partial [Oscillospiraceae bacterium]